MRRLLFFIILIFPLITQANQSPFLKEFNSINTNTHSADKKINSLFFYVMYNRSWNDYQYLDSIGDILIALGEIASNSLGNARGHLLKMEYYESQGKLVLAKEHGEKALLFFEKYTPLIDQSYIYSFLGSIVTRQSNINEALNMELKGLKIAELLENKTLIGNHYTSIGLIHIKKKDFEKALKYHKDALEARSEAKDEYGVQGSLTNIGITYSRLKKYDQALYYHKKAMDLALKLDDPDLIAFSHNDLGATNLELGKYDLAITHLKKSVEIREQIEEKSEIGYTYSYLGQTYCKLNEFEQSLYWFNKALASAKNIGNPSQIYGIYKEKSKLFEHFNQYDSAYIYLQKFHSLKDSVSEADNLNQVENLLIEHDTRTKEKRIKLLNKENKIILSSSERKTNYLIISILSFLILIGILFFIIRNKKVATEKLQLKLALKEAKIKQETAEALYKDRMRISKELHDNIGSNLTFLDKKISNDLAPETISEIKKLSTETMTELRKTVWLINKEKVELDEFVLKLKEYMKYVPQVHIYNDNLREIMLTSNFANSIMRVIQEFTNNSIKYGHPSEIKIHISTRDNHKLEVSMSDNGCGFDLNEIVHGNGIRNMQERINELNGEFDFGSSKGKGTYLNFTLSI